MLILTRSKGQRIIIGPKDVIIEVISVKGSQVRIGVTAPDGISIHREEVYHRITEGGRPPPPPHPKMEEQSAPDNWQEPEATYACVNPRCDKTATQYDPAGSNRKMLCDQHFEEELLVRNMGKS